MAIGGLGPKTSDGNQPVVSAQRIAQMLGLDTRQGLLCDPREHGKIEAGRMAGLKVYTLADVYLKLESKPWNGWPVSNRRIDPT